MKIVFSCDITNTQRYKSFIFIMFLKRMDGLEPRAEVPKRFFSADLFRYFTGFGEASAATFLKLVKIC